MLNKSFQLSVLSSGIVLMFILLPSIFFNASGQSSITGFSVNPKIGIYSHFNESEGFTGGIEIDLFEDNTIYSIDYFLFGEFTLMDPVPDDVYNQIGFMIGKYTDKKFFRVQYQLGLAPFFGKMNTESLSGEPGTPSYRYYEEDKFFTLGLVAKLGFKLVPVKQISIGIDVQTNLNLKQPVFFPCLSLEVGRLKN